VAPRGRVGRAHPAHGRPTPINQLKSAGGCRCSPHAWARCQSPSRCGAVRPSERFPKLWTVMDVGARPAAGPRVDTTAVKHAADTLAAFLRALHLAAPADAPVDTGPRRTLKTARTASTGSSTPSTLTRSAPTAADVRAVWDDAVAAPAWEVRRCGCMATCIPRTSSSRTGRWRHCRLRELWRRRPRVGPGGRLGCCCRRARPHASSPRMRGRRGDGPARPRAGRAEEPLPDADGPERGPRPARRQAAWGPAGRRRSTGS